MKNPALFFEKTVHIIGVHTKSDNCTDNKLIFSGTEKVWDYLKEWFGFTYEMFENNQHINIDCNMRIICNLATKHNSNDGMMSPYFNLEFDKGARIFLYSLSQKVYCDLCNIFIIKEIFY